METGDTAELTDLQVVEADTEISMDRDIGAEVMPDHSAPGESASKVAYVSTSLTKQTAQQPWMVRLRVKLSALELVSHQEERQDLGLKSIPRVPECIVETERVATANGEQRGHCRPRRKLRCGLDKCRRRESLMRRSTRCPWLYSTARPRRS